MNLSIGFITPLFGINLFMSEAITEIPYLNLLRWMPPYFIFSVIAWIIVVLVPRISLVVV
ncbi:MAG: TRAP transporter large permease subunit [Deltaproteobacteria bacterium]|nr:TRAP transporter large permease subunit [Deltaproteobacteria bacterium]